MDSRKTQKPGLPGYRPRGVKTGRLALVVTFALAGRVVGMSARQFENEYVKTGRVMTVIVNEEKRVPQSEVKRLRRRSDFQRGRM